MAGGEHLVSGSFFCPVRSVVLSASNHKIVIKGGNDLACIIGLRLPRICSLCGARLRIERSTFAATFSGVPSGDCMRGRSIFLTERCRTSSTTASCLKGTSRRRFTKQGCFSRAYVVKFALTGLGSLSTTCRGGVFSFGRGLHGRSYSELRSFLASIRFTVGRVSSLHGAHISFLSTDRLRRCLFTSTGFCRAGNIGSVGFTSRVVTKGAETEMFSVASSRCLPSRYPICRGSCAISRRRSRLCVSFTRGLNNVRLCRSRICGRVFCFCSSGGLGSSLQGALRARVRGQK